MERNVEVIGLKISIIKASNLIALEIKMFWHECLEAKDLFCMIILQTLITLVQTSDISQASDFFFFLSVHKSHKFLDFEQREKSGLGLNPGPPAPKSHAVLTAIVA